MKRKIKKEEVIDEFKAWLLFHFFTKLKELNKRNRKSQGVKFNYGTLWTAYEEYTDFRRKLHAKGYQPNATETIRNFRLLCQVFQIRSSAIVRAIFSPFSDYVKMIEQMEKNHELSHIPHGNIHWRNKNGVEKNVHHAAVYLPDIHEVETIMRQGREEEYCDLKSGHFSRRLANIIHKYELTKECDIKKKKPRGKPGCKCKRDAAGKEQRPTKIEEIDFDAYDYDDFFEQKETDNERQEQTA